MSRSHLVLLSGIVAACIGCNFGTSPKESASKPSAEAAKFFLAEEPSDPKSVTELKESAEDGEEVTLIGRIGGSESPFVSGRASFTIVDTALVPCSEKEGDSCRTPWDYCCDTDRLPSSMAVVKVIDEQGKTVPLDPKEQMGMRELQTLVVKGKAQRDDAGNLTILTPAVFVKK